MLRRQDRRQAGSLDDVARSTARSRPPTGLAGRQRTRLSGRGWCRRGPRARMRSLSTGRARVTATCSRKMPATVPTSHGGGRERSARRTTAHPNPCPGGPGEASVLVQNFPATLRRGDVDLHAVGIAELEDRGGSAAPAPSTSMPTSFNASRRRRPRWSRRCRSAPSPPPLERSMAGLGSSVSSLASPTEIERLARAVPKESCISKALEAEHVLVEPAVRSRSSTTIPRCRCTPASSLFCVWRLTVFP